MTNPTHSTNLSRRSILGGLAALSAAGVSVAASAAVMTSRERFEFHLAEMQKAAGEIFDIRDWDIIAADGFTDGGTWRGAPMIVANARRS